MDDARRELGQRALQAEIAKLQARNNVLEGDMKALMEEYVNASDEEAPEKIKKNIRARMPQALTVVDELLVSGTDGIRSSLARWIIDRGLTPDMLGGIDAEAAKLNKMFEQLTEKPE